MKLAQSFGGGGGKGCVGLAEMQNVF